ncbi:MAG: hypothetical protein LBH98_01670 [Chitinispirillales bacterium]|jgi:hypothetical protein|nr:hypothetical protein [Chitinispirillales bacterium]
MRNFLKTAIACLTLCAGVFAQNVGIDLSVQENPQERYEHFKKMKNVGTGLIIGGAVFATTGVVIAAVHAVKAEDYVASSSGGYNYFYTDEDKDNYDKEVLKSAGWIIASSLGYTVMLSGIPLRIVGRIKAEQWKNKIPTAYIIPNGAKLVWNF